MVRLAWVATLLLITTVTLCPPSAHAASPAEMRLLLTHYGVRADGRSLMYREPTGPSWDDADTVIFDAQTLTAVRRVTLPTGCTAVNYRFGHLLLRCPSVQSGPGPSLRYSWG